MLLLLLACREKRDEFAPAGVSAAQQILKSRKGGRAASFGYLRIVTEKQPLSNGLQFRVSRSDLAQREKRDLRESLLVL
jgi:hypothetical protein